MSPDHYSPVETNKMGEDNQTRRSCTLPFISLLDNSNGHVSPDTMPHHNAHSDDNTNRNCSGKDTTSLDRSVQVDTYELSIPYQSHTPELTYIDQQNRSTTRQL